LRVLSSGDGKVGTILILESEREECITSKVSSLSHIYYPPFLFPDECSKIFGGLDILSIDAVIDENGKHTILEINDTATGLNPFHVEEDVGYIKELVLGKMAEAFNKG